MTGEVSGRQLNEPVEELLDLVRSAREDPLPDVLQTVAKAVTEMCRFKTVAVNVYRPAWDDYEVVFVRGTVEADEALRGTRLTAAEVRALVGDEEPRLAGTYFLTAESAGFQALAHSYTPDIPFKDDPDAWQAEDGVIVMLTDTGGAPLGFLSVDEPANERRPTYDDLRLLRTISSHAEQALESARYHREMASNARMNADMVRASARVAACASEGELGEVLCEAIIEHLGFERVATYRIGSAEELELRRTRGWDSRELLVPSLPVTAIKRLVSGEGERSGTSLVHASALFPEPADGVRSRRNGRGAFGWNDGCLLVPIRQGADELTGVIVVEDPVDHRLPSDQQRNLLRLLADQTAGAWLALQMRAFQARLLGLMLAREGAPSLAQVLADTVRAPVALLDWSGQPVARAAHESRHVAIPNSETLERHRTERPPQYADPREPIVRPLELGDQVEGYLVVERSSRAQPIREMAVDQAVTTFALQLAMISNAEEVEHRMLGTLVDELLDSDAVDLESLARRAERLGYSLDALTCAIAVEPLAKPELFAQRSAFTYLRRTVRSVLEEAGCGAVVAPRGDTLLALITDPTSAGHREIGHQLVERAQIQTGLSVAAGISRTITDPSKLAQAVREAQQALEAARTVTELAPVALAGELDLHSLLLSAPRSEELKRAAVRLLSPLVEGRGRSSDLLTTLETYLDAVGHLESTAQRLGIHINTLRNRLRRIESLLGLELRDARARVDLQLALELAPADELGRDGAKLNGSARQPSRRTGL